MINIIQKGTSTVRATAEKLQYSGTFMEIPQLAVTVKSPTKIAWEIGDFITWGYDGATYVLKELPQEMKQSTSGTYGEAFVYENIRFIAPQGDLKYVDFLDVVKTGSTSNFSTLPTFSFYGDCYDFIDRINANIGRLYANWEIKAADVESGDIFDALNLERNVEITSPIKVWDALGLFYSMWGLGFVYSYDTVNAKHNLTIGATGGETGNFSYGQGNGLYMVSKNIAKEDAIVTRLRPYGSTRNMPSRYYNNKVILIDRQLFTDPMVYLPNLMIPYWKWAYTNGDPKDAYINCNNVDVDASDASYAKYGIREASIFFDGTNGLPDIYPTIERITAKNIRDGIAALQYESEEYPLYHSPSVAIYPDTERMDLVKLGDTLTDNGVVITTEIYTQTATFAGDTANYPTTIESFTLSFDPIYSKTLAKEGEFKATLNSQEVVLSGVDTTIDSAKLKMWLTKNGSRSRLVTTIEGSPVGGVFTFILPDFTFTTQEEGDTYAVEVDIDITIPPIGEVGIANVNYVFEAGSLTYELTKITPITTFAINVKQIGFDIKRFLPNAGQSPVISMTSGACQGREFIIKDTRYNSATDDWTLTCARQSDTSLSNQWFPNANFHIAQGDSFVVLNINMPEFFINIAEERLYTAACDWLRKRKEPQWVYEPKIDEIYMAHNPQVIKEGMMMPLTDTDLAISGRKTINTVTITENEGAVRTFDVVLREDTDKDLLKYINEAAKRESSSAVGSITNADTSKTESAEKQSVVVTSSSGTAPTELPNPSTSATPNTLVLRTADADANVRDINASRKVKGATLILPQSAPTLSSGEAAIYSLDSGFSGETPSGAGSVTSISMVVPLGLSVTPETITESGTFAISYASGYSIPTNTKQGEWDSAYNHSQLTGNPHGTTAADVGAIRRTPYAVTDFTQLWQSGFYAGLAASSAPITGDIVSIRLPYANATADYRYGVDIAGWDELYHKLAVDDGSGTWYKIWSEKNSNSTSFSWSAAKLTSTTLLLPQTTPSLTSGEMAIYGLESGFSGELPSGAGSVTSIALTMPTGFSVSGSPITESGTFGVTFASGYFLPTTTQFASKLDVALKGSANGLAELDENGFVKNTQLPSYVDDVIEVDNFAALPVTGEAGKIYVTKDDNKTWRWGGSVYVQMYAGIALGETSSTAYRGDRGKIAYDHSQLTGNPHGTTAADVGAIRRTPYAVTDFTQLWQSGFYAGLAASSAPITGDIVSIRLPYANATADYRYGVDIAGWDELYHKLAVDDGSGTWYKIWSEKNSNSSSVAWAASAFTEGGTLLSNKYLGIFAKAADSDKLDGQDSTYFQVALTNPVTGTGASGYLPKFTGASTIGNSPIYIDGTGLVTARIRAVETMGGGTTRPMILQNSSNIAGTMVGVQFSPSESTERYAAIYGLQEDGNNYIGLLFYTGTGGTITEGMRLTSSNNLWIGYTSGRSEKFAVNGTTYFNGNSQVVGNLTMTENINTNLRIPKVAPTSPTSGQYYFYIVE